MELNEFKQLIKRKKATIFSLTFLLVILVVIISLVGGLKYSAKAKVLVIQDVGKTDAFTVSRSNEYLGNLLSQIVYSGSFFNLVLNNNQYKIDQNYFNIAYNERLKLWQKTVSTRTISDTGIIEINVFHSNPDQARLIALAINDVLMTKNSNYHGSADVKVSILDQPLVSNYPDKPNLIFNSLFALLIGLLLSLIFIYLYPEKDYDVSLWPKSSKTKNNLKREELNSYSSETRINNNDSGPISVKVETYHNNDNFRQSAQKDDSAKEELADKDIFEPRGNISSILR